MQEIGDEMPKASRTGDNQTCPQVDPGPTPHVGGPVTTGCATVLVEGAPGAHVGSLALCVGCGRTTQIGSGCRSVFICGSMAARLGDTTCHGGVVTSGAATVFIGSESSGALDKAQARAAPLVKLE